MRLPRSGDLDRLVRLEYKTTTLDPVHGTPIDTWLPLVMTDDSPQEAAQLWAMKRDAVASRGEYVRQGAEVSIGRTTWTVRYRDDVDSSMRLIEVESDEIYQIVGPPSELGRRRFLELPCEKFSTD